ncbi:MAG TPA: hypothetical protein VIJ89_03885 [Deferrimonas sp.]
MPYISLEPAEEGGEALFHPDLPFRDAKERVVSAFEKRYSATASL